ncbi:MAG: hypothetical protein ABIN89_15585 [Chitinophagaceae bacterium]
MDLSTIEQLDHWMTTNCYNDSYGIGGRNIHEGYGLGTVNNLWVWYYTERGEKVYLEYFQSEKEAVVFAFKTITDDKSANRHMIGFIKDKSIEKELLTELQNRNINSWKDEIPYGGPNDKWIRIFVFGCDIEKALDLKDRFAILK